MRRGPARAQVDFANVTFSYNERSMYLAILMAHVGLCTGRLKQQKERCATPSFSKMESLHFAKHGFHVGASAVEVGAFHQGIRMLAQPLARWLAAWAGLIGWLAGWLDWLGWLADVHPRCDDYRSLPSPFPALQIFLILATSSLL